MASFTAGTTFQDNVAGDVTAAKLAALVNAATPTSGLIQDRTAETAIAADDTLLFGDFSDSNNLKRMTVANFRSAATFGTTTSTAATITSGTITTLNSTTGTITTGVIPTLTSTTLITTGTGTAAAPAIVPTGDTNTGIFFPAADTIAFSEGGAEAMRIDSSGNVGIGIASPAYKLEVNGTLKSSSAGGNLIFNADSGNEWWTGSWDDLVSYQITRRNNSSGIGASYLTISTSGNVGIGTASPSSKLSISFNGTTVAGSDYKNTDSGSSAQNYAIFYRNTTTQIGSITGTNSATSYNTSSDYRLKTNLDPVVNGIERIKQLPVYRFNWINDQGANKVDGFVAHEAKLIVPECVVGEKDAVDADGNPIYQGIDQSKIVPLLTAALKEAIAKIEVLESKVAALEAA